MAPEVAAEPLPLTDRQAQVLSVVTAYHEAVSEACPCRVVARKLGMHHEAVRGHYAVLYRKGWLESESSPATPRAPFLSRRADR